MVLKAASLNAPLAIFNKVHLLLQKFWTLNLVSHIPMGGEVRTGVLTMPIH